MKEQIKKRQFQIELLNDITSKSISKRILADRERILTDEEKKEIKWFTKQVIEKRFDIYEM